MRMCTRVYVCISYTNSSKKQCILHLPLASLEKESPPRPLPVPARLLCRKQGPLEVQTLITELEYFSKLQGMAPGDKRKQESAELGGEVGRAGPPGRRRRGWGLGRGRPRASRKTTPPPTRKARRPLQAAPGEGERPCRRGPPWGRGGTGGQRRGTFLSGPEQRSSGSCTSYLSTRGLKRKFPLENVYVN